MIECPVQSQILSQLNARKLLMVNRNRRNGLIIYKQYHAEFAGPGAAVGGDLDADCLRVVPVGKLSLLALETYEERKNAYSIRLQWIRLAQQLTDKSMATERVEKIIDQFENFFNAETIAQLPDEALALLVGVLPQTVRRVRRNE